jgi:MFS family permease
MTESTAAPVESRRDAVLILQTVFLTFLNYLTIGLPLGVLPTFVHSTLGLGAVLAGFAVSIQYLATIVTRAKVGEMTDRRGGKPAVTLGFAISLANGALLMAAALPGLTPSLVFLLIVLGRVALGLSESLVGTGAITWAIGLTAPKETVRIISWNGIASYGGIALGAPVGVTLAKTFGFWSIGFASCLLVGLGLILALLKRTTETPALGESKSAGSVLWLVFPHGCALALATSGFGVIAAFVTLLFESHHWTGGSMALSVFGLSFMASRLLFSGSILRHGGLRVTLVALLFECAGLLLLWSAPGPLFAMLAAGITAFGFAPIFPALGVVAVGRVPDANRGAAISLFAVFFDLSLGTTGPVAGLLVERFGTAAPFLLAAAATLGGFAITAALLSK